MLYLEQSNLGVSKKKKKKKKKKKSLPTDPILFCHAIGNTGIFFFGLISQWELMSPGCGLFGPQGLDWQELCRRALNIPKYLIC